jgi:pimeloyl-ACP methyl ester carboxylesterase
MVVQLHVEKSGEGTPLVLLHAFPLSSAMFGPLRAELPDVRLITPDLRGFGRSPLGADDPSLDAMADDVAALLDERSLDRVAVGGVSMGGYVTMALLRRHPHRLAQVFLLDTKASADAPEAAANRLTMAAQAEAEGSSVVAPMVNVLLGETTRRDRPDVATEVQSWLAAVDPAAVAWGQRAMAARPASFDVLAEARVPGVVVVGEEDELSPVTEAEAMVEALGSDTPLHVVPGAGHLAALEQPAAVAEAIRTALAA